MPYLMSSHVPIWRVHHSRTNPQMEPISHEALHCTLNIPCSHVATWEAARAAFQSATSGEHK